MEVEASLPLEVGGPLALVVLILKAIERLCCLGDDYDGDKPRYCIRILAIRNEWIEREERKCCADFIRLSYSWHLKASEGSYAGNWRADPFLREHRLGNVATF